MRRHIMWLVNILAMLDMHMIDIGGLKLNRPNLSGGNCLLANLIYLLLQTKIRSLKLIFRRLLVFPEKN